MYLKYHSKGLSPASLSSMSISYVSCLVCDDLYHFYFVLCCHIAICPDHAWHGVHIIHCALYVQLSVNNCSMDVLITQSKSEYT